MAYEDLNMKNYIVGDCGMHFEANSDLCIEGKIFIEKTPTVEKALKLWEKVGIPKSKSCAGCKFLQTYIAGHVRHRCILLGEETAMIRCKECLDMFGEE